jgi:hypothetical protein
LLYPVRISRLSFGPITLHNVSAFATDLHYLSEDVGFPIDAMLGDPIFANHVTSIDYPKQQVTIYTGHHAPKCPSPIPMALGANGIPTVTAKVILPKAQLARTVHLIVDLGTGKAAAAFGREFLNTRIGNILAAHKHAKVRGNGLGGKVKSINVKLPELQLGGQRFYNLPVSLLKGVQAFNGSYIEGSLGVLLWNRGSITFDYPGRTLCIQAHNSSPKRTPKPLRGSGAA